MKPPISTSILPISTENYTLTAWNLVALLLATGRPISPAELAEKCTIFRVSPEFIEFLCFIPNSPIFLSKNDLVSLSTTAFRAVGDFFAISMPKVQIEVFGATASVFFRRGDVSKKYFRKRKSLGSDVVPLKKRAIFRSFEGNEVEKTRFASSSGTILAPKELPLDMPKGFALKSFSDEDVTPLMTISNIGLLEYRSLNDEDQERESKLEVSQLDAICNNLVRRRHQDEYIYDNDMNFDMPKAQGRGRKSLVFESLAEISTFVKVDGPDPTDSMIKMETCGSSCLNLDQHDKNTSLKTTTILHSQNELIITQVPESKIEDVVELPVNDCGFSDGRVDKEKLSLGSCGVGCFPATTESFTHKRPTSGKDVATKPQSGSSPFRKNVRLLKPTLKQKAPPKLQHESKVDIFRKKTKGQIDQNPNCLRDNVKHVSRNSAAAQEKFANKHQQKSKYPEFESYTVEEEEGSGGYGTVYRARRNTDGVIFAIKCPHANAHINHLKNERKMLQRFGGKNSVIKYEGSLKSGDTDCFVLEHVEHDRPEVLKREIDINQLRWYGFCLFKALSSLHRQGVFHRDVKPGNFLFSCKTKHGHLIDFNLAKDLHHKPESRDKLPHMSATEHVPEPQQTFASTSKRRKILSGKHTEAFKAGTTRDNNHNLESKLVKRKAGDKLKAYDDLGRRNSIISQGADRSGLTSKDLTSTRTSRERLREPIPCQGRKELINLAQEAMQISNLGTESALVSKRKRVAASPVVMDRKFIYLTPTPLHSSGNCVPGAGLLKNRGDTKPRKEGPCVGTKGFRAPEVLLRSLYQGPKIDVWSAGVTLLYLITGKMPFTGDPEQNMTDIVKMKGNEELWEVAKLHNRESSIPLELLDIKFLEPMTIKEWCVANTKRKNFLDVIPDSLFDLVEKCLIVSPRLRITTEEASRHEFFASCHHAVQKMKSRRLSQNQQSRSNSSPLLHEPVAPS